MIPTAASGALKEKPYTSQHPKWPIRGAMNIRDRLRFVTQSRFEEELCLSILGIRQVLHDQKRLEMPWSNRVRQAESRHEIEPRERLAGHAAILGQ